MLELHTDFHVALHLSQDEEKVEESASSVPSLSSDASGGTPKTEAKNKARL